MKVFLSALFLALFFVGCGASSMELAHATRDLASAQKFVKEGHINAEDILGKTVLSKAISARASDHKLAIIKYFIDQGADVNHKDSYNQDTPLLHAISTLYSADIVKVYGVDKDRLKIITLLLDKGADVNAHNEHGKTVLLAAAGTGDMDLVKLLVERGANIHARSFYGGSAVANAINTRNSELVEYFLNKGVKFNYEKKLREINDHILYLRDSSKSKYNSRRITDVKDLKKYLEIQAFLIGMKDPSYGAYFKTKKVHTIDAYSDFLLRYPQSPFRKQVESAVDDLKYHVLQNTEDKKRSDYVTFLEQNPKSLHKEAVIAEIVKYDAEEASKLYAKIKESKDLKTLDKFLKKYPYSSESEEVKKRILDITYVKTSQADTVNAYKKFQTNFPNSEYEDAIKKRLVYLEQKQIIDTIAHYMQTKNIDGMVSYVQSSDSVKSVAYSVPKIALLFAGPPELFVIKILHYKKQGLSDSVLGSKIRSIKKPYKNFSLDEILILKKHGLSDDLLAAMLDATSTYEDRIQRQKEQQALIAKQEAIAKGMQESQAKALAQMEEQNRANAQMNQNAGGSSIGSAVSDVLIKKGAEKLADKLFDNLF